MKLVSPFLRFFHQQRSLTTLYHKFITMQEVAQTRENGIFIVFQPHKHQKRYKNNIIHHKLTKNSPSIRVNGKTHSIRDIIKFQNSLSRDPFSAKKGTPFMYNWPTTDPLSNSPGISFSSCNLT